MYEERRWLTETSETKLQIKQSKASRVSRKSRRASNPLERQESPLGILTGHSDPPHP